MKNHAHLFFPLATLKVAIGYFFIPALLFLACIIAAEFLLARRAKILKALRLERFVENPILAPHPLNPWESEAVFNPAAVVHDGRVHLFYRALGPDGVSRIGYALSDDGIHFERLPHPVYDHGAGYHLLHSRRYAPLSYNPGLYASGGGWGGSEDPRAVMLEGSLFMNFNVFEGWGSIRVALTELHGEDLTAKRFHFKRPMLISPSGETHKNWVLFPEKIGGRYAILHALTPTVMIDYLDSLEELEEDPIQSNNNRGGREGAWDTFVRGAAAPPLKTQNGWLLLYHGMNPAEPVGYKVGAMLLDLIDPSKILYRSIVPVLEPLMWYENDWKPGVVYASGAVIFGDDLLVYYGGGDKRIAAARVPVRKLLKALMSPVNAISGARKY